MIYVLTCTCTCTGKDVITASAINSVQFFCAVFGKLASGALLALPPMYAPIARLVLFVLAPLAYWSSHFVLLDLTIDGIFMDMMSVLSIVRGDPNAMPPRALHFAHSTPRLICFAAIVGTSFGLIFGMLQALPVRLFGRRDLPKIQSVAYSAVLLSTALLSPLVGYLRDALQGYEVPLLLTFSTSLVQVGLVIGLMQADMTATAGVDPSSLALH
jgi:hypothetical protein